MSTGAPPELLELSPLQIKAYSEYGRLYDRAPFEALEWVANLWKTRKGTLVARDDPLLTMLMVCTMCFYERDGYYAEEGSPPTTFPGPQPRIWDACIAVELPLLLLDMIQDDLFFKQTFIWKQAVLSLISAFSKEWILKRASDPPQSLADKYFKRMNAVWDLLWAEKDHLLLSRTSASPGSIMAAPALSPSLIIFAGAVVTLYVHVYPARRGELLKIPSIVGLTLAAWTQLASGSDYEIQFLPPEHHHRPFEALYNYRETIFTSTSPDHTVHQKDDIWRLTIDMAIDNVGPSKFIRACMASLSSWTFMVGPILKSLMQTLHCIVIFPNRDNVEPTKDLTVPVRRAHWDQPMLPAIAEALKRESSSDLIFETPIERADTRASICISSCHLLQFTQQGLRRAKVIPVMDGLSAYTIMSLCLLMLTDCVEFVEPGPMAVDNNGMSTMKSAVLGFGLTCEGWARMCNIGLGGANQAQAAVLNRVARETKTAAAGAWYNDMRSLRSHRERLSGNNGYQFLIRAWVTFGKAFGLKETVERDQHDARNKHFCSWIMCQYHLQPSPTALFTCAGCGEQRYCSRVCQKSDWKQGDHRSKCRRLTV